MSNRARVMGVISDTAARMTKNALWTWKVSQPDSSEMSGKARGRANPSPTETEDTMKDRANASLRPCPVVMSAIRAFQVVRNAPSAMPATAEAASRKVRSEVSA